MNKALKQIAFYVAAVLLAACARSETGPVVLQGDIEGDPGKVVVVSYIPGHSQEYYYPEVKDGRFEFSLDGIQDFTDLIVSVGDVEFGARINANDTLRMSFDVKEFGREVEAAYAGATEKASRIWTDFYNAYLYWGKYNLRIDRDTTISYDRSIALLDRSDSVFRKEHGADMNKYYNRRASLAHGLLKAILLEQKAYETGSNPNEWPEYIALMERVDPNDPDAVTFPLVIRWMHRQVDDVEGSETRKSIAFMQRYGKTLTNPDVKEMLAHNMVSYFEMEIQLDSLELYEEFFNELDKFTPEHPEIAESGRRTVESVIKSMPGTPLPEAVLETPEGGQVKLSSFVGKVLYIDVWASWCAPCRKQIPYLQQLADRYADDDRICFISISTDRKKDDWLEALEKENPTWPQFRFEKESHNEFCGKLGITAIPRFMLVDKEGNFIDSDCERPSSEDIDDLILQALGE